MIPVNRYSADPFYRYKMPPVQINHDSTKTYIINLDQIAKSLHRNPHHILKYLSYNLGCTCIDKNILNGVFNSIRIQSSIYDFIDIFVLCKSCENPETKFLFDSGLQRRCNSCGEIFDQEENKLNHLIIKDKNHIVNEDTKYDHDSVESKAVVENQEFFKKLEENTSETNLHNIFSNFIKIKDLSKFDSFLKLSNIDEILLNIENMLEKFEKEEKIENYLNHLIKLGFSIDSIEKYFSTPKSDKKRSPLIKKNVEYYFENLEE